MKRDWFKVEVVGVDDTIEMTKKFYWFMDAHKAYLEEIEKRDNDGGIKIILYILHDNDSQKELMHCQI